MTANHRGSIGFKTLPVAGALAAGLALSGCGQVDNAAANLPATGTQPPAADTSHPDPATEPSETTSKPNVNTDNNNADTDDNAESVSREADQHAAATDRCHTSMLTATVRPSDQGAGQRYAELTLRNASGPTCTLYGYGGMQLLDDNGQPLPTNMQRTPSPGPEQIRLAKGESATATLHWNIVPSGDEPVDQPCQATPAAALITPPDEEDPLKIQWDLGQVCGQGTIDGSAYR